MGGDVQPAVELQGGEQPDSNWEPDWATGAASGDQRSRSRLLWLHTRHTGLVESMHQLRHNRADGTKTEDKMETSFRFHHLGIMNILPPVLFTCWGYLRSGSLQLLSAPFIPEGNDLMLLILVILVILVQSSILAVCESGPGSAERKTVSVV